MRRAASERPKTVREWKARQWFDELREAGRYRKGRRALGCHRWCSSCRDKKLKPTRKLLLRDVAVNEWLEEMNG
jgi:hypothetical protein